MSNQYLSAKRCVAVQYLGDNMTEIGLFLSRNSDSRLHYTSGGVPLVWCEQRREWVRVEERDWVLATPLGVTVMAADEFSAEYQLLV